MILTILDALGRSGFKDARRVAWFGVFVEYVARKPEPGVGPATFGRPGGRTGSA